MNRVREIFENRFAAEKRKCDKCGKLETFDNIMLKYNFNGSILILCDDCFFEMVGGCLDE